MKKPEPNDTLDRALADLYRSDIPAGYPAAWRDAVKREEPSPMKPNHFSAWLKHAALPLAAAVVLVAGTLITGALSPAPTYPAASDAYGAAPASGTYQTADTASFGAENTWDIQQDAKYAAYSSAAYTPSPVTELASADNGVGRDSEAAATDRKIVRTVDLTIATTDYEADYAAVLALAERTGGYAASVSASEGRAHNRTASFDLRIPSAALEDCLTGLAGIGRITDRYETAEDYTTQYSDTQLRLETQQNKMERLEELLIKAETVEDLLKIENEIADTQYRIDSLQSSLLSIDRQVDYSAVGVYLREQTPADTANAEEISIGERLLGSLRASLRWLGTFFENMLVFLIAVSPVLGAGLAVYLVIRIIRRRKRRGKPS